MKRTREIIFMGIGILTGFALCGPAAQAAATLTASPSSQTFYLNGRQINLTAFEIGGSNYVKLRDIGQAVNFGVDYDGTTNSVHIDPNSPYQEEMNQIAQTTPTPSVTASVPTDGSQYIPKNGDKIACGDGTTYTITDASGYDASMFADGPLGPLPTASCDWSSFPSISLPPAEARHFSLPDGEYLFLRNLYETRRMQYVLMNLAGTHPDTSQGGRLRYGSKGTPYVSIGLTIPDDLTAHSFWPGRESELTSNFNSCPPGKYYVEAWDVFKNGKFLYTEYKIATDI